MKKKKKRTPWRSSRKEINGRKVATDGGKGLSCCVTGGPLFGCVRGVLYYMGATDMSTCGKWEMGDTTKNIFEVSSDR